MVKKLAIAIVHGMGSHKDDQDDNQVHLFAKPMIEELKKRLKKEEKDPDQIAWKTIYWADVLEGPEMEYFNKIKQETEVDAIRLRKFVITALGDASGYRKVDDSGKATYQRVHERVRDAIKELYENELESNSTPLIILAHSLGSHVMSNYIYDLQKPAIDAPSVSSNFEKMHTLVGLVTFGCNIPLFTFAYETIEPIKFPAQQLPEDIKEKSKWLNFYDPDDILGYPLKPICEAYNDVVDADNAINVGGIFTSWNPLSHTQYWTDNSFTKPVSTFISDFL